jgi:hypothetical protein
MTEQPDIHDLYRALTRTTTHRERYTSHIGGTEIIKHHISSVPALILQLCEATPSGSGEMTGSEAGKSRPAARIEAIDTLILIDIEASAWLRKLGLDDPGNTIDAAGNTKAASGTIACLNALHAAHASLKECERPRPRRGDHGYCCTAHHIEADTTRWWHSCRIITGYDTPSWRPDNTCPVCEVRRSLRINLATHSALCVECRTLWPPDEIGLLAEYIRWENADTEDTDNHGGEAA